MGLFGFGKSEQANTTASLDLTKKLNLSKEEVHGICLTKAPLNGLKAKVGLCIDYSGSMRGQYNSGKVQALLEKILPMAMEFDDDGSMECWIFENGYHRLPDVTLNNISGYIARETKKYSMGGTNYAPVMQDVIKAYKNTKIPAYVLFVTDGDNSDKRQTTEVITDAAKLPIFWQFVGLGNDHMSYLEKLDDMGGRYVDNADFFKVNVVEDISYKNLLDEFPGWLEFPEVKNMLR